MIVQELVDKLALDTTISIERIGATMSVSSERYNLKKDLPFLENRYGKAIIRAIRVDYNTLRILL